MCFRFMEDVERNVQISQDLQCLQLTVSCNVVPKHMILWTLNRKT